MWWIKTFGENKCTGKSEAWRSRFFLLKPSKDSDVWSVWKLLVWINSYLQWIWFRLSFFQTWLLGHLGVLYWHRDRHVGQWDIIESLEIYLYIYGQLIFFKGIKTTQWGEEWTFQQMVLGKLDIHIHKHEVGPLPCLIHKS